MMRSNRVSREAVGMLAMTVEPGKKGTACVGEVPDVDISVKRKASR
jgi:hypothetical protein